MVIMTGDTETYERQKNGLYKPILDATGKYFLCGCITNENMKSKMFYDRKEMWDYIIETGKKVRKSGHTLYIFFHNIKYDFYGIYQQDKNLSIISEFPFIASYFINVKKEVELQKWEGYKKFLDLSKKKYTYKINPDGFVDIDMKEEAIRFIDSMGLFRTSLKEVGKMVGLEKLDLPQELDIKNMSKMLPYVTRDTEILIKAIKMLKNKMIEDGIKIKRITTMNQIAMSYLVKMMKELNTPIFRIGEKIIQSKARRRIRKAYRGGRVEAWKTGIMRNVSSVDCNNLYGYSASIMRFPDLRTEVFWNRPNKEYWGELLNKIGVCRAMMFNKDCELGLLPIRLPHLSYYPKKGKYMIGTWTNKEVVKAVKEGYKIMNVQFIITYDDLDNPFKIIMPKLYKLRKDKSLGQFNNDFYKSIMNGGIGKFAQIKTGQEIIFDNVEKTLEYAKDNWESLGGINDKSRIIKFRNTTKNFSYKSYYCPLLSALITAEARMYMYDIYKKIGKDKLIYGDTDNCVFKGKIKDIENKVKLGQNLGEFKTEFENQEFECWGRKARRIGNLLKISGVSKNDVKGYDKKTNKIKFKKMQGLKKINTGEFVEHIRDLNKQIKDFNRQEEILEEIKIYIDESIMNDIYNTDGKGEDNITFFKKELDILNKSLEVK